jgi:hypothetical protein
MAMGSDGGAAQTTRDYVRPARVQLARLRPSAIRAWISSRSNSAIAAKILMVKRPLGVVVSTAVLSLTAQLAPRCRPPKNGAIDHPQPSWCQSHRLPRRMTTCTWSKPISGSRPRLVRPLLQEASASRRLRPRCN